MQNKRFNKYLMQAVNADDVISNHAYGKVARTHRPLPKRRPQGSLGVISSYKDSIVGSVKVNRPDMSATGTDADDKDDKKDDAPIAGNRPSSGLSERNTDSDNN